ncbi:hypothetical protein RND71_041610 [Anisodus tanguticus]|uniref:16S rRNA (uracil(1498)-N(3))-methyltransferase n=1 Tax=Anisodus tanguticus TaxID=243964 RepID=A0AAE1UPY9_9SOLA|nr:hypothetical protein RND71_041610 [Anisodus tanguticus]
MAELSAGRFCSGPSKFDFLEKLRGPKHNIRRPTARNRTGRAGGGGARFGLEGMVYLLFLRMQDGVVRVKGDEFWHMTRVLRLTIHDRVELFDGKGVLVEGCIQNIDQTGLDIVVLENPKSVSPHNTQWHVYAAFGTLKGGRADWLVEKCTELGSCSVTPLLTERSPSISENRADRLQRVSFAAAKQCKPFHYDTNILCTNFFVDYLLVKSSKLSFIATAEAKPVFSALSSMKRESSGLMIIGPEGDFTEKELNVILEAGKTSVGLGPHRLQVETATVALLSALMLCDDQEIFKV